MFSGEVPGPRRKHLVDRFREDPDCRLFLSTDAGGVGLNLQHASVVVNLDQPWNPAVLEQRIGRVHRLGQHRPVRVVHLIAQGTIEEGMLGLLAFKKSVFAGVLDGGQDEVFLGGSRLNRFMESVDRATASIPEAMPADGASREEDEEAAPDDEAAAEPAEDAVSAAGAAAAQDPWATLLSAGLEWVEQLRAAATSDARGASASERMPGLTLERDRADGPAYLKIPMPKPELLGEIAGLLARLARGLPGS